MVANFATNPSRPVKISKIVRAILSKSVKKKGAKGDGSIWPLFI